MDTNPDDNQQKGVILGTSHLPGFGELVLMISGSTAIQKLTNTKSKKKSTKFVSVALLRRRVNPIRLTIIGRQQIRMTLWRMQGISSLTHVWDLHLF